jgi:hypothetical protein
VSEWMNSFSWHFYSRCGNRKRKFKTKINHRNLCTRRILGKKHSICKAN